MNVVRLRRAAALVLACAFAFALPVSAYAATTFSSEYPMGTVRVAPQIVGTTAFGSVAFDTRSTSLQVKVDGVSYRALISAGSSAGYWTASEYLDPVSGVWKVRWSWTPSAATPNKATVYAYPVFSPPLASGPHTAVASIKDKNGVTWTDTWTFTYAALPVLGAPTPDDGARVATTTPAISLPVSSAGAATATATINGGPAPVTIAGGVATVQTPVLANDSLCTVRVTVTDPYGGSTTKTWSFFVQVYPEMVSTISACTSCHPGYENDPDMHADCLACHNGVVDTPHQGTPSHLHVKADVSACSPCHVSELTVEHARRTDALGAPLTCATCHESAAPIVAAAIAAGDSACLTCHPGTDHAASHATTLSAFCAKSGCHVASNLVAEHMTSPINPARDYTCETCHASTTAAVSEAIAAGDKNCSACHGLMVDGHDAMHESVMEAECLYCHAGSISAEHIELHNTGGNRTCASCHESTNPRIITAITSQDRTCAGCHDDAGHNTDHASNFDGRDCAECHTPNTQIEHFRPTSSSAGARCANCHREPSSVVVDDLLGQPWDGSCSQASCHPAGSATEIHLHVDSAHTLSVPAPSCIGSGCHSGTDLRAIHSEASTTTPEGARTGCGVCHSATVFPASNQCADCHPDRLAYHGFDPAKHVGTDAAVRVASLSDGGDERGCSDTLPDQRGCHDITNIAALHADAPDGCNTCHGPGKTPSTECLTCHPTSGSRTANPPLTLEVVSWYHHNNARYLIDPADATPNHYYNSDGNPPSGWYDSAYYQDCSDLCHHSYVDPGTFSARTGQRMWFSAPGGGGWYGPSVRTLTSTATVLPAGAYLDFSTYYLLNDSWGNGSGSVEISTDGGVSWVSLIGTVNGATASSLTGDSSAWVDAHYDLSPYAGQTARLRFRFNDNGGWCGGWALDDVTIGGASGVISTDGAESGSSNWESSYWIRSMSAYPAF